MKRNLEFIDVARNVGAISRCRKSRWFREEGNLVSKILLLIAQIIYLGNDDIFSVRVDITDRWKFQGSGSNNHVKSYDHSQRVQFPYSDETFEKRGKTLLEDLHRLFCSEMRSELSRYPLKMRYISRSAKQISMSDHIPLPLFLSPNSPATYKPHQISKWFSQQSPEIWVDICLIT